MDMHRLWNWAVAGSSAWVLFGAMGASANTFDGDLTYARPDRGETVHRVPANGPGDVVGGPVFNTSWSAPGGGSGFSLPGNSSVRHPGAGFGRLYEAVSGDRSYPSAGWNSGAGPGPEAGRPVRRVGPQTDPVAENADNNENREETPISPIGSGDQAASECRQQRE
jgi:hypothetical protein